MTLDWEGGGGGGGGGGGAAPLPGFGEEPGEALPPLPGEPRVAPPPGADAEREAAVAVMRVAPAAWWRWW